MDDSELPPLDPVFAEAPASEETLAEMGAPLCPACGALERMTPAGTSEFLYWTCEVCGYVQIS